MKKHSSLSMRQLLLACLILPAFTLLTVCLFSLSGKESAFEKFSRELFVQEMCANTLSLHYSLADPKAFGIEDYPVVLPCYEPGSEAVKNTLYRELLNKLEDLPKKRLSFQDKYACELLERSLLLSQELEKYPYYSEPLSPTQGAQCQLPILLSEYTFRSRQDVEDYLSLLSQTGDYFASLLVYEQEKLEAGTLQSAYSLSQTANQCDTIVTKQELENGTHFLQTGFLERLKTLSSSVLLSKKEIKDYIRRNNEILNTVLLPAYQNLSEGLRKLENQAPKVTSGLASLPLGRDYYRLLLAAETGSSKTVEEIRSLLESTLASEYDTVRRLAKDYPGCLPSLESGTYLDLGLPDEMSMLEDLKKRISQDFPALKNVSSKTPSSSDYPDVTVKKIAGNLCDYCSPAYYLTSPIDKTDENVIYINPKNSLEGLELYTTLAHEGYPGHLYQNAFTASHLLSLKHHHLRQLLNCGGYLEGWALYVEQYSYDYASRLLAEQNRPADAVCVQMEKHNRSLQLCLYSLLDIMIHYDGAGLNDIYDTLEPLGITDRGTASIIYNYICQSPGNYLKYYLGYLEILELKQSARELWQDGYSDLAFHQFLLEWGPADFTGLKEVLERYRPHSA